MYLCHITLLMLKDTKSLGNNKASAWESRGFVVKKKGCIILTHPLTKGKTAGRLEANPKRFLSEAQDYISTLFRLKTKSGIFLSAIGCM